MSETPFLLQDVDGSFQAVAKPDVTKAAARAAMRRECPWCPHNINLCQPQLVDLVETVIGENGEVIPTGQLRVPNVLVNGMESDEGRVSLPVDCPLVESGNIFASPPK